ncbi:hypothetical protein TNCV_4419951 [Trichonephila clavipes]|nr:hypothetical protein TNCV_4419951 [Trichonephila clavipes]
MSSSLLPLKTHRVGEIPTLKPSKLKRPLGGVVVRRGGANSGVVLVTLPWLKMTRSVAKSPRVADQCNVNILSLTRTHIGSVTGSSPGATDNPLCKRVNAEQAKCPPVGVVL